MVARLGEQTGDGVKTLAKRTPSAASRSICEVRASALPYEPSVQLAWSSVTIDQEVGTRPYSGVGIESRDW